MDKAFVLALVNDNGSARSMQKSVGPSEIGGCRRRMWHRVNGTPTLNTDTLSMAAWMGTAIHSALERKITRLDPFGERFLLEKEVTRDGITGHVDCYDKHDREVIDWKTTTKRRLSNFPSDQQRWQVHIYGYLMIGNGYPVDRVTLVGIPRDGNEIDVKVHTEDYDEDIAVQAFDWLRRIQEVEAPPHPGEPVRFCKDYCPYYNPHAREGVLAMSDGCPGGAK